MLDFLIHGEAHPSLNRELLVSKAAQQAFNLITNSNQHDFELIELRYVRKGDSTITDIIVVDCINDQVPTRNRVGILSRERLALVFSADESLMPEVRALRPNFPKTLLHQNHVNFGDSASLCLYFEPWMAVQRTWTAQKHLHRILWWLAETAKETLHREDQPVEQIYFESPIKLIIPSKFEEFLKKDNLIFTMSYIDSGNSKSKFTTLIGEFLSKESASKNNFINYIPIIISLSAITHGNIEFFPETLGSLEKQLSERGTSIFELLCNEIKRLTPQGGLVHNSDSNILLIIHIPIKRTVDGEIERYECRAFLILKDLSVFGESIGVLHKHDSKYYSVPIIGNVTDDLSLQWQELPILPVEVKTQTTNEFARDASGIIKETADFYAILAGTGALGGVLADLWSREAWGRWTLVDPDQVEPHNIIRHIAKNNYIGVNKAVVAKYLLEANFFPGYSNVEAIPDSILETDYPKIQSAIASANFFVDATTTLYAPRDLSQLNDFPRSASVFLTPSGFDSVLLLEDDKRQIRLESLESQYYRAIINNEWGEKHLTGHSGSLWVGAGCRDMSSVISFESIQLHASILARQIRILRDKADSFIGVWRNDPLTGSVDAHIIPAEESISENCGEWRVLWGKEIQKKIHEFRAEKLPNETGGVILGYIDQKLRTIFIVDVLSSPPDSKATSSEFVRGVCGLKEKLDEIAKKTANIVDYIGEWHSHPRHSEANQSGLDVIQLTTLSKFLAEDGLPAVQLIVGENGINIILGEN